jgi:hypothetical protein
MDISLEQGKYERMGKKNNEKKKSNHPDIKCRRKGKNRRNVPGMRDTNLMTSHDPLGILL